MKLKRTFSLVVLFALMISMFVGVIPASAAYDYLFPVNNGGVIGYAYGYSESYGSFHVGIDLHNRTGDDTVYAAYSGVVGATANSCPHVSIYPTKCEHYSTFGNYIRIDQDDGTYAYYGHLKLNSLLVKPGDRVVKGQPIATIGSSGYSTGPHLHFEVRKVRSDTSSTVNVNPVSSGGEVNYTYTGYGATTAYATIDDGVYYLKNSNGLYMAVEGATESNGQNIVASEFQKNSAFQFDFKKTDGGYEMRPLCAENSIVNNYGTSVSNGNNITLWEITDHASQKWKFEAVENGFVIRSAMNSSCCIAVDANNNVYVATYTGAAGQVWTIENLIEYDANGGTVEADAQFKSYGVNTNITEAVPARDGYFFLGWAEDKDAKIATYPTNAIVTANKSMTLYAVWTVVEGNLGDNLAYQKDYTISGSGVGFDNYTANLTDGEHYENIAYDNKWFGLYYSKDATENVINAPGGVGEIVIDLGDVYSLNAVNVHFINAVHASVAEPTAVNIYTSADGESFEPAGVMPTSDAEPNAYWGFAYIDVDARYVKLEIKLSDVFVFLNEIEVYGTEVGASQTKVYALGDINMDETVDQYDYILAKRAHFGTITFDENQKVLGDMDENGTNDQYDYILVKRIHFQNYSTDKTVEIVVE